MADIDRKSSAFVDQNHGKKLKVTDVLGSDLIRVEGSDRNIRLIGLVAFERFGKDAALGRVPHPLAPDYPNQKDQTSLQFATKNLKGVTVTIHSPRREVFTGEVLPGKDLPLQEKDGSLGAIVYLSSGESWQEFIVRNGYAYYDNHRESTLTKVLPLQGMKSSGNDRVSNPGKNYARILYDAEREARIGSLEADTPGTPKGIWQEKYASGPGSAALANFIQAWGKQSKIVTLFDRNNYPSSTYLPPRYQTKGSPEKAKKIAARRQARLFNATTRDYSDTPIGAELRKQAEKYFPEATSLDIIKKIVSGGHETSITQIGALWCGIPTAQQESLSLPTTAHVASISEMRKDGDVQTILGQGFIQSAMGDRPPYEGITMTLIVEPDGVETFLVPLFTQCRMDPIIPVRNLYLSRFARPLMSYKSFYSDIFGALPAFLKNDNAKTVQPNELQLLNYLYMSVPVYIAVAQIQVENYTTTAGSFIVTINGNITDVSTTYGKYPVYAKTIEQSFQLQRQRVTMADRLNTRAMIQETAQELSLTPIQTPTNAKKPTDAFNEINTALAKNYKSIGTVTLLAKDGKLMRIPETVTVRDIQRQLKKEKQVIRGQDTKLMVDSYIHYRAASGPRENKGFLRSVGIIGPNLLPGPKSGSDIVAALIRTRGFPLPNAASFISRAEIKDPSILGTEPDPSKNGNIGFLRGVSEVERTFALTCDIPAGITQKEELFNKSGGFTAYPAGFKNVQEETVLGFDGAQIMEPFELIMTNPAENGPGSVLTNLDLEFACSFGIPVISLTKEGSSFRTKLITVSNGNTASPLMLNSSIEGNVEQRGTRVSVISKKQTGNGGDTNPTFNAYYEALKASVQNNSAVFVPELTSSAMYKSSATDPEFATIKYSDYASFPMRVSDVGKTNADAVAVGTTFTVPVPAAKSGGGVGVLSSGQTFPKQKRQSMIQPVEVWTFQAYETGNAFTFKLRNPDAAKIGATSDFTLKGIGISSKGRYAFYGTAKTKNVIRDAVFVTKRRQDELLNFIASYIGTAGQARAKDYARSSDYLMIKALFDSTRASSSDPVTPVRKTNALRNVVQAIDATKAINGTRFLDESEPYVYSLMYQMGAINENVFDVAMTFKSRPDRVPYKPLTDVQASRDGAAVITVRRIGRPSNDDAEGQSVQKEIRRAEEILNSITTVGDINRKIGEYMINEARQQDPVKWATFISDKRMTLLGMQSLLIDLIYPLILAAMTQRAGAIINRKLQTGRSLSVGDSGARELGLADKDMLREVNQFRDELLNELIKIKVPRNGTSAADKYIVKLANTQLSTLTNGIKAGVEVLSASKTPSGKSYFSIESIVRMMVYGSLDFGRGQDKATTTLLRDLVKLYGEIVEKGYDQAWTADKKNLNVVVNMVQVSNTTTPSGNVTVQSPLMDKLVQIVFAAKETIVLLRAIRTATGNDFGLSEAKEIKRIPPIPRIALIEQYGISEPIMAAGSKKPRFQVVGSSAMTVIMDLQTDTENLFLGKLSVIRTEDIKIAEEGADALYNLIREPGEEVTAYNMLKSGRSLDRKRIINSNVPTVITGDVAASTLATDFRLVRRAVSIGLETEALASALGHSSSHIEVREPLLLALGMYRFVAKSTQIKSDDETQSWKMTLTLVPHEATYTTNRNLRRLNTGTTNDNLADIGSWIAASFDREQAHNISEGASAVKKQDPVALSVAAKVMGARVASSHYFAGLVLCHAITSAKRKLFSDSAFAYTTSSENLSLMLSQEASPNKAEQDRLNLSIRDKMALKLFVESAYTNALPAAGSGAIRQLTYPFTPELSLLAQAGNIVSPIVGGFAGEKAGAALGRVAWSSKLVGGTAKFFGKRIAPFLGDFAVIVADMYTSKTELQALGAGGNNSVIAADEEAMLVSLTEDFTFYAMNFLVDFAFAESKGVGKEFIEKIATEAQQIIATAGDFGSARTWGGNKKTVSNSAEGVDTNSEYFKVTWPAPAAVSQITAAPKVALLVANFANSGLVESSWEKGKKDIANAYHEWMAKAHWDPQAMSPMDICGEEVLELLRDGQLSMSKNTIPALMTIPGSIVQDIDFHYAMSRTIFGRLKLNIFAMGMLDQTFVKSKSVPFEMLGSSLISQNQKNPAVIGLRRAGLSYDPKKRMLTFVANPDGLTGLASAIISNKTPSGHFVTMPFPVLSKLANTGYHIGVGPQGADVFYTMLVDSVKTCFQVTSADTKAKIGGLPNVTPLLKYASDGELTADSYKSVINVATQYLALGIGYVLQEANGLSIDAYLKNDLVTILSNGVLEVLAKDKQKDLGIDEAEAIALVRSNPQLYDLNQGKNENTDQLRAALDRAVLYTTGDLKARQACMGEYAMFLSAIRSLVLQQMEATEADDASADQGDYKQFLLEGERIYGRGGEQFQSFSTVSPTILGIRKALRDGVVSAGAGSSGNAVKGPWKAVHWAVPGIPTNLNASGIILPGSLFFLNRGKDVKSNFGNQKETIEMLSALGYLFRASYGIVNPLYVPSIFAAGYMQNKQLYLVKTPFTNATQAYMAIRKQPGWWSRFLASFIRIATDEMGLIMNIVVLVVAVIVIIFASAAIAAAAVVIAIGAAVWALAGILIKPAIAKLALGIDPWRMEAVGNLASPIPLSTMFMGAKIINDIVGSIHFVDIERITQWPLDPSRRVSPPDVSDDLFETGYILNDTLAYLTLPLLMRRNATHVRDIIPPGGFIVPDLSSFNTKAEALVDGLVANSFLFEDEYANLPQHMEQTARLAIETQATGVLHEFGIPTSDADLKRYGSAKEFMRCMSEMFIAESGYGTSLAQSTDDLSVFGGMVIGINYLHAMTVGRKLKAEGRSKDEEKLMAEYTAAMKEMKLGDFLSSPSPGRASTVAPNFQNQWILSTTTTTPTKGKPRLTGPFTRSTEIHAVDLGKEPKTFPVTTGDVELIGVERNQSANLFNRRTPFFMRHEISPEFSTTSSSKNPNRQGEIDKAAANLNDIQTRLTAAQVASSNSSKKKLPDLVVRQQEVQKLADEYAKAKQALDKLRNAPTPTEASFQQNLGIMVGFQGFNSAQMTYAMVAKQAAQTTTLFESRNLYNVLDNYSKTLSESSTEFRGRMQKIEEYLLKYAQSAIGVYSPDTIMIFDARGIYRTSSIGLGTLKDIPLLLALAIKQALDEAGGASSEDPLVLRMKHVVAAIVLAADFLWYLNFLCSETEKQKNAVRDPKDADSFPTTAWLKDPGKVTLLKKVTDAADTQLSNAGGKANEVSARYAARSAVASTYILGKIGAYLDPNSTSTVRGLKRVQDTTQEALMAPLQNYPVAKVYFVERNKGVTTMYDDLYGYADVMKVDIFDTWKDPESTAIVELSNTENKLDNIIRSRSQSENPFETRARNTDPLSGIMLKGGTRMQTYLGYGNVLSEEEQYLFEIGSVSKTPDNRTVIMGKGPGWVLKTPMGQRFNVPKEITFENIKTVFRRQSGISAAAGTPAPSELGDITEVLQESVPAVARSLIIYGLSVIGSADGFGRLGSKLPFGSDVMLARLPDSYSEQGLGDSAITYVADLFRKFTYKTLFKSLTIDDESADVATTAIMNQANSFEVNIKLSPFIGAASNSALTNLMSTVITRLQDIAATVLLADAPSAIWRFRNENHFEFIKAVLMNVPNHRFFVRSYGTDGSMVIGTKDDYYSLFPPRSMESILVQRYVEEQKVDLSLKAKSIQNVRRMANCFNNAVTNVSARRTAAELLSTTLATFAIASDSNKLVIQRILGQIAPVIGTTLAVITTNDGVFISDIRTLYDAMAESYQAIDAVAAAIIQHTGMGALEQLVSAASKASNTAASTIDTIISIYASGLIPGGTTIAAAAKNAGIGEKLTADVYKRLRQDPNGAKLREAAAKTPVPVDRAGTRLGVMAAYITDNLPDYFKSAQALGSVGTMPLSFASFLPSADDGKDMAFLYTMIMVYHQMINVRVSRLQALSPEMRPFYTEHRVFSEYDIVANNITTMVGFNEFNFTFEKASKFITKSRGLQVFATAGSQAVDMVKNFFSPSDETASTATESSVYSINPIAKRSGFDGYESVRQTIAIVNPDYFGRIQGMNFPAYLNVMAAEQMSEMVRDWYGGMLSMFGNAKRRPMDGLYIHDSISDMYGPADIKEIVHSFSSAGFISTAAPSVSAHVDATSLGEAPALTAYRWTDAIIGTAIAGLTYKLGGRLVARGMRAIGATGKLTRMAARLDRFARGSVTEAREAIASPGKISKITRTVKNLPKLVAAAMIKTPFIGLGSVLKNIIDTDGRQVLMQFAKREGKNLREAAAIVKTADVFATPESQAALEYYKGLIKNKASIEALTPQQAINAIADAAGATNKTEIIETATRAGLFQKTYGDKSYAKALTELETLLAQMEKNGAPIAKVKTALEKVNAIEASIVRDNESLFQIAKVEAQIVRAPIPGGGSFVTGVAGKQLHNDIIRTMAIGSANKSEIEAFVQATSKRVTNPVADLATNDTAFLKGKSWGTEAGDIATRIEGYDIRITTVAGVEHANLSKVIFESEARALRELQAVENEMVKGLSSLNPTTIEDLKAALKAEREKILAAVEMRAKQLTDNGAVDGALVSSKVSEYQPFKVKNDVGAWVEDAVQTKSKASVDNLSDSLQSQKIVLDDLRGKVKPNQSVESLFADNVMSERDKFFANSKSSQERITTVNEATKKLNDSIALKGDAVGDVIFNVSSDKAALQFAEDLRNPFFGNPAANPDARNIHGDILRYFLGILDGNAGGAGPKAEAFIEKVVEATKKLGPTGGEAIEVNAALAARKIVDTLEKDLAYQGHRAQKIATILSDTKEALAQRPIPKQLEQLLQEVAEAQRQSRQQILDQAKKAVKTAKTQGVTGAVKEFNAATAPNVTSDAIKSQITQDLDKLLGSQELDDALLRYVSALVDSEAQTATQEAVIAFAQTRTRTAPGTTTIKLKNEFIAFVNTVNDVRAQGYVLSSSKGTPLKRSLMLYGGVLGGYAAIKNVLGAPAEEYFARLASEQVAKAVRVSFLNVKGEPYVSNLEGLTKDAMITMAGTESYGEVLKSRYFDFLTREGSSVLFETMDGLVKNTARAYFDIRPPISDVTPLTDTLKFNTGLDDGTLAGLRIADLVKDSAFAAPIADPGNKSIWGAYGTYGKKGTQAHGGLDIGATIGTPVYAVADGIVVFAQQSLYPKTGEHKSIYGRWVEIVHSVQMENVVDADVKAGTYNALTRYAHMASVTVNVGDQIKKGQQIGTSGNAAFGSDSGANGPHLHISLKLARKDLPKGSVTAPAKIKPYKYDDLPSVNPAAYLVSTSPSGQIQSIFSKTALLKGEAAQLTVAEALDKNRGY